MKTYGIQNEIYEIKILAEQIKRKDSKYETKKYRYDF